MTTFLLTFFALLLAVVVVYLLRLSSSQRRELFRLLAVEEAIVAEERRMFDFLHDLGEAIWSEDQRVAMFRLIVEGAMRVTQSHGGAIYLFDEPTNQLVPRHLTEFCAPLVDIPESVRSQMEDNPGAVLSYLRIHAVNPDEGVLGRVFTQEKGELIVDHGTDEKYTLMLGPLNFGAHRLGVLVLSSPKGSRQFTSNDFEVFNSITEQSAVALANATSHQEVIRNRADQQELDNASEIQKVLLPDCEPNVPGFSVAGRNIPARRLSGDYFDFLELSDGRFGAVIADVSGKGLPAALITIMCRTLLRSAAPTAESPAAALAALNRIIAPDMREDMFITMTYLTLQSGSPTVTLSRAGHTDALLWRQATGKIEAIRPSGLGVGIDTGSVFERVTKDFTFEMETGDCLLLYTDGVNEALTPEGDEFGEARIESALIRLAPLGPNAVVDGLIAEVDEFLAGKRSHDDITLIALQKTA